MTRTNPRQLVAKDRAAEIAALAEAVADEHCPSLPIDAEQVARDKGLTVSFGQYGPNTFDGLLEHRLGRFHIYCNIERVGERPGKRDERGERHGERGERGERHGPRARFTLAHELGHYFIDEHRRSLQANLSGPHASRCEYESPILAEREADLFAANLLMPAGRFVRQAKAAPPGMDGVISLAGRFATSLTATAIRYVAADVAPCLVVKWNWSGYAWKRLSASAFAACLRTTYQAARDLPDDCPTRKALDRQQPPECGYFQAGTTAAAWLPHIKAGDWRDAVFIEQAAPLGRYGVLTFLYTRRL